MTKYLYILLLFLPSISNAFEVYHDNDWQWTINGFGTVGGVYSTDKNVEYLRDITQARGANGFSFDTDSRVGLQTNLKWHDIEIVAQGISRYHSNNTFDPELTMAFIKFDPVDNLTIRGGRLLTDLFFASESRNIGYSYLTIRPPVEEFGIAYMNYFDGGDIAYRFKMDDIAFSLKASGGFMPEHAFFIYDRMILSNAFYQLQLNAQWDDWKARLSYASADFYQNVPIIEKTFPMLQYFPDANSSNLMKELTLKGKKENYYNVALSWTPSPFIANLSLSAIENPDYGLNTSNLFVGFLNLGYQIDEWTPYISFAWSQPFDNQKLTRLSPVYGIPTQPINNLLGEVETMSKAERRTYSLGMRYDFATNMDAKIQIDYVEGSPNNYLWRNYQGVPFDGNTVVFGLTLDFVF